MTHCCLEYPCINKVLEVRICKVRLHELSLFLQHSSYDVDDVIIEGYLRHLLVAIANGIRKVWLAPLMTVAGDHAVNDLFGPEKGSWKQTFMASGMRVETIEKGLGEYPALVDVWVQNLKSVTD